MGRLTVALLVAASAAILAGCYEDTDITLHDPGVYRGAKDPLLALQANPEQQARLVQRLREGQGDR